MVYIRTRHGLSGALRRDIAEMGRFKGFVSRHGNRLWLTITMDRLRGSLFAWIDGICKC